jgi:hypothetical protein
MSTRGVSFSFNSQPLPDESTNQQDTSAAAKELISNFVYESGTKQSNAPVTTLVAAVRGPQPNMWGASLDNFLFRRTQCSMTLTSGNADFLSYDLIIYVTPSGMDEETVKIVKRMPAPDSSAVGRMLADPIYWTAAAEHSLILTCQLQFQVFASDIDRKPSKNQAIGSFAEKIKKSKKSQIPGRCTWMQLTVTDEEPSVDGETMSYVIGSLSEVTVVERTDAPKVLNPRKSIAHIKS